MEYYSITTKKPLKASVNKPPRETQNFELENAYFSIVFADQEDPSSSDMIKISTKKYCSEASIEIIELDPCQTGDLINRLIQENNLYSEQLTQDSLESFLNDAIMSGARVISPLGENVADISRNYSDLVVQQSYPTTSSKCRINWVDISLPDNSDKQYHSLRWINVERPNEEVLRGIARNFDIKFADLIRCIKDGHPPSSYRYAKYLVNRLDELELDTQQPMNIKTKTICAFLGENFMITLSAGESEAISRVMKEVQCKEAPIDEILTSNYLCSRLLGATLHINETATETLDRLCNDFINENSKKLPGEDELRKISEFYQSISKALNATQGTDTILCALQEKRNLFGSDTARDALGRYQGMLHSTVRSLELTKQAVKNLRDSWQDQSDRWRNDILFKIALLSGAVSLPSMVAGFFGMNFSHYPIPDSYIWGGIITSALISIGLVFKLLRSRSSVQH